MIENLSCLVSAKEMALRYPETFSRPSDEDLAEVKVGDFVKICRHNERFWVKVQKVYSDRFAGLVANSLVQPGNTDLKLHQLVCFEKDHVFQI